MVRKDLKLWNISPEPDSVTFLLQLTAKKKSCAAGESFNKDLYSELVVNSHYTSSLCLALSPSHALPRKCQTLRWMRCAWFSGLFLSSDVSCVSGENVRRLVSTVTWRKIDLDWSPQFSWVIAFVKCCCRVKDCKCSTSGWDQKSVLFCPLFRQNNDKAFIIFSITIYFTALVLDHFLLCDSNCHNNFWSLWKSRNLIGKPIHQLTLWILTSFSPLFNHRLCRVTGCLSWEFQPNDNTTDLRVY